MDFWNACWHPETTDADEDGKALCVKCGATVQARLTAALLADTFEMFRRDHGTYGRHSMRCVETPDGWCCATDCTMR